MEFGADAPADVDALKRLRDSGIARVTLRLPAAGREEALPILDRFAALMRQVAAG